MLPDNEAPLPAEGAPQDLQNGAHIIRIYNELSTMRKDITTTKEDIAFIKGKLSEQKEDRGRNTLWLIAIFSSIMGVIGTIGAVFALRK